MCDKVKEYKQIVRDIDYDIQEYKGQMDNLATKHAIMDKIYHVLTCKMPLYRVSLEHGILPISGSVTIQLQIKALSEIEHYPTDKVKFSEYDKKSNTSPLVEIYEYDQAVERFLDLVREFIDKKKKEVDVERYMFWPIGEKMRRCKDALTTIPKGKELQKELEEIIYRYDAVFRETEKENITKQIDVYVEKLKELDKNDLTIKENSDE